MSIHGRRQSANGDENDEHAIGVTILGNGGGGGDVGSNVGKPLSNLENYYRTKSTPNGLGDGTEAQGIGTATTVLTKDTALPLPQSLGLAAMYIATSMFFFLTIRYSKAHYTYDSAFLVLAIESTKLMASVILKYREDKEFLPKTVFCGSNRKQVWKKGLPFAIPSLLYAIYNNMTFFNLNLFDPGTYQVFMQTRILFTGVLFTLFLNQALTYRKWCALILLTIGVAVKYFSPDTIKVDTSVFYMLFQAVLSSLAGVYNEYVFKKDPGLSIHQQNFFMYFYAIFFNFAIGLLVAPKYYLKMDVASIAHPIFILIILLGAGTGLSAAFILKFINVIVKAFASAVEVLLTAVMAWLLLREPLSHQDVLAAFTVMMAVYIYYSKGIGDSKAVKFGMR